MTDGGMSWKERGRTIDVFGDRIFVVDTGGEFEAPPLVVLHGFPTCSHDFERVLARLSAGRRVVVHDHLGFGLSDKPLDRAYSLVEQAEVAVAVWREVGLEGPVDLLAHDYGTSVATELLARRERAPAAAPALRSVTLCNGSVHIDLAKLSWPQVVLRHDFWGPVLARRGSKALMGRRLRKTLARPEAFTDADIDFLWSCYDGQDRAVLAVIARYTFERSRFARRWIGALERLDLPAHVLWGREDPIAVPAIAEALAGEIPGARLTWLDGLAHYPMVEDPDAWADAALDFLDGIDAPG